MKACNGEVNPVRVCVLLFLSFAALSLPSMGFAQQVRSGRFPSEELNTQESEQLFKEGKAYFLHDQIDLAKPVLERALPRLQNDSSKSTETVNDLLMLGSIAESQHRLGDAQSLLNRALDLSTHKPAMLDLRVMVLLSLAGVYDGKGSFALERNALDQAIADARSLTPRDSSFYWTAIALNNIGLLSTKLNDYRESEHYHEEAMMTLRPIHADVPDMWVKLLSNLAIVYERDGKLSKAEPLLEEAVSVTQPRPEHAQYVLSLTELADLYRREGRYHDAQVTAKSALTACHDFSPIDSTVRAKALTAMIGVSTDLGQDAEAQSLVTDLVTIASQQPHSPEYAQALALQGDLNCRRGFTLEGEPMVRQALALEKALPTPANEQIGLTLQSLGICLRNEMVLSEADQAFAESLSLLSRSLSSTNPKVADLLVERSQVSFIASNYAQSEGQLLQALSIYREAFGIDNPKAAYALVLLARVYTEEQRTRDAAGLLSQACVVYEQKMQGSWMLANCISDLAEASDKTVPRGEIERLLRRALEINQHNDVGQGDDVAVSMSRLATFYMGEGRTAEAESLLEKAIASDAQLYGSSKGMPMLISYQLQLGELYREGHRYGEAVSVLKDALETNRQMQDPHGLAFNLLLLAVTYSDAGDYSNSQAMFEEARPVLASIRYENRELSSVDRLHVAKTFDEMLGQYLNILAENVTRARTQGSIFKSVAEAFQLSEQIRAGNVQSALFRARAQSSGNQLLREIDAEQNGCSTLRNVLLGQPLVGIHAISSQDASRLVGALNKCDARLHAMFAQLYSTDARLAELIDPTPIEIPDLQKLLQPGEALLSYYPAGDRLLMWLIPKDRVPVFRVCRLTVSQLSDLVSKVRPSLDQSTNSDLNAGLLPVDVADLESLYHVLVQPFEEELNGITSLVVVPSDTVLKVPLQVLLTDEGGKFKQLAELYTKNPNTPQLPQTLQAYSDLSWLVRRFAVTIVPSATSLRALRAVRISVSNTDRTLKLLGIGAPDLHGDKTDSTMAQPMTLLGSGAIQKIRNLSPLPYARSELTALAKILDADPSDSLKLGSDANKPEVMKLNRDHIFQRSRVVAFATHALTWGSLDRDSEPALVLTPPDKPSIQNDGLLRLSDVLSFQMDPDWLILAGCDTSASDSTGEGLAGLTRAFMYAGAGTIVVSNWGISDQAAQILMKDLFSIDTSDKRITRSEVLQRAMVWTMNTESKQHGYLAHPFAWAGFVLVGEGSGSHPISASQ